jgi:hypothetical protein
MKTSLSLRWARLRDTAAGFRHIILATRKIWWQKAVQHPIDQYQMALAQLPRSEPGLPRLAAIERNYARLTNSKGNRALGMLIAQSMVRPALRKTIVQANEQGLLGWKRSCGPG